MTGRKPKLNKMRNEKIKQILGVEYTPELLKDVKSLIRHHKRDYNLMRQLNYLCRTYGVETLPETSIDYLNSGDSYSLTFFLKKGRLIISTYADMVEKLSK